MGNYDEALSNFEAGLMLSTEIGLSNEIILYRAITYREMGRYDLAIDDFKYVLDEAPSFIEARVLLGETFLLTEDVENAICSFEAYLAEENDKRIEGILEELNSKLTQDLTCPSLSDRKRDSNIILIWAFLINVM